MHREPRENVIEGDKAPCREKREEKKRNPRLFTVKKNESVLVADRRIINNVCEL